MRYKIRRFGTTYQSISSGMAIMASIVSPAVLEDMVSIPDAVAETPTIRIQLEEPKLIPLVYNHEKEVDYSALGNKKVGDLFGDYLGQLQKDQDGNRIPVALPTTATVNFADNLQMMWNRKLSRKKVSGATQKNASVIVERYRSNDPNLMNVDQFISGIDSVITTSYKGIDWPSFCSKMKLKDHQCQSVKVTASRIKGKHLTAYGMTELFPGKNGEFNKKALDTMLQFGGANYVHSIPALYDKYMSLGFYQFTSYAVRHDTEVEGASIVSLYSENKIPGSVVGIVGDDHHRAAYYFAIYNVARLAKRLDENQSDRLKTCGMTGVTQFIATAHHLPAPSISSAKKWIKFGCKDYKAQLTKASLKEYATKTTFNLQALVDN